jgi:DNA-binding transcriptional LysR family regulator
MARCCSLRRQCGRRDATGPPLARTSVRSKLRRGEARLHRHYSEQPGAADLANVFREVSGRAARCKVDQSGRRSDPRIARAQIDLLITRATGRQNNFHSEVLFDEPFVFVVGTHSELARKRRLALADIIQENWVLPPYDSAPGRLLPRFFGPVAFHRRSRWSKP